MPAKYWEPPDHTDVDDATPVWPTETLTTATWGGWWSSAPDLDTDYE
jgi:hypothetical protein